MAIKLGKKRNEAGYGLGRYIIEVGDEALIEVEDLRNRIVEAFGSPDYQPPALPSTALELLALSRDPDASFDEIVALLEQDAVLAASVLRAAQSPLYAGIGGVQSLHQALVRLGLATLRDLVLEVAVNLRVFAVPAYAPSAERLRRHSAAVAQLARLVARHARVESELAFLCGLFHDVGIAGILLTLGDVPPGEKLPDLGVLWPAIDAAHEEAGALMAILWELPQELPLVIGGHHQLPTDAEAQALGAVVCVADRLAEELGAGLVPRAEEAAASDELAALATFERTDRSSDGAVERARETLGVDDAAWERLREEGAALLARLRDAGD